MALKIFSSFEEEEKEKWKQMAQQTPGERWATMVWLQRMAYPDTFDPVTGKRKPLEHRITIGKRER